MTFIDLPATRSHRGDPLIKPWAWPNWPRSLGERSMRPSPSLPGANPRSWGSVAGVEFGGAAVIGQGLVVPLHRLVGLAAFGEGVGVAGVEVDGTGEVGQGLVVPLHQPVGF